MSKINLLLFAMAVGVTLPLLLWRMIRAEDGDGFMPISRDLTYILASAFLGAFALACFVFSFVLLIA
jgi:hypothetical protein